MDTRPASWPLSTKTLERPSEVEEAARRAAAVVAGEDMDSKESLWWCTGRMAGSGSGCGGMGEASPEKLPWWEKPDGSNKFEE